MSADAPDPNEASQEKPPSTGWSEPTLVGAERPVVSPTEHQAAIHNDEATRAEAADAAREAIAEPEVTVSAEDKERTETVKTAIREVSSGIFERMAPTEPERSFNEHLDRQFIGIRTAVDNLPPDIQDNYGLAQSRYQLEGSAMTVFQMGPVSLNFTGDVGREVANLNSNQPFDSLAANKSVEGVLKTVEAYKLGDDRIDKQADTARAQAISDLEDTKRLLLNAQYNVPDQNLAQQLGELVAGIDQTLPVLYKLQPEAAQSAVGRREGLAKYAAESRDKLVAALQQARASSV